MADFLGSPHKVGDEMAGGDGGCSGKTTPNRVSPGMAASPSKISTDSSLDTNIKTKVSFIFQSIWVFLYVYLYGMYICLCLCNLRFP